MARISALPNELLDRILAYCDKSTWLAACSAHRTLRSSAQRLVFRHPHLTALHESHHTSLISQSSCKLFLHAIDQRSLTLANHVKTLHLTCELDYDRDFEYNVIGEIIMRLRKLRSLTVAISIRPNAYNKDLKIRIKLFKETFQRTWASKKVLTCVYPDRPVIQDIVDVGGSSANTELVMSPDIATRGIEMPVISFNPDERFRLSRFSKIDLGGFVIQDEHIRGISANAIALKDLKLTLQGSQSGNNIVAALAPLYGRLETLDLQRHPNCAGNPRFSQDKTDFSAFTKLRVLCASSSHWFKSISCNSWATPHFFTYKDEDRVGAYAFLPPNLEELDVRFDWPNGIFVQQVYCSRLFRANAKSLNTKGFPWLFEILDKRSTVKRIALTEEAHTCRGRNNVMGGTNDWQVPFHPSEQVNKAFREKKVELDIKLLEFPENVV